MTTSLSFAALLRRYRLAAKLTQQDLAERALLSVQAISTLERGTRRYPRRETVAWLARALGLSEEQHGELVIASLRGNGGASGPTPVPRARPLLTPRQLPPVPPHFTGRGDLAAEMVAMLTDPNRQSPGVVVSTIAGMGGIGKTALAVYVGHLVADSYPDGQLYIDLHGSGLVEPIPAVEALGQLLRGLGIVPEAVPTDMEEAACLLRSWLAGRRVLLVLDNAASASQIVPLLPGTAGSAAIITSRPSLASLPAVHAVSLGVLSEQEAVDLLSAVAGPEWIAAGRPDAMDLVRLCGWLPLGRPARRQPAGSQSGVGSRPFRRTARRRIPEAR